MASLVASLVALEAVGLASGGGRHGGRPRFKCFPRPFSVREVTFLGFPTTSGGFPSEKG